MSGEQTELENARQVIRELRRELESQASRVREGEACGLPDGKERQAAAEKLAKLRADVDGLQLELEAKLVCHEKDNEFLIQERDEAKRTLAGCGKVRVG